MGRVRVCCRATKFNFDETKRYPDDLLARTEQNMCHSRHSQGKPYLLLGVIHTRDLQNQPDVKIFTLDSYEGSSDYERTREFLVARDKPKVPSMASRYKLIGLNWTGPLR